MGGKKVVLGVFLLIAILVIGGIVYTLLTGEKGIVGQVYNEAFAKPINKMFKSIGLPDNIIPKWADSNVTQTNIDLN